MRMIGSVMCGISFLCILAIANLSDVCAKEACESRILSHNLEIELFLKEHKLKAVDHMRVSGKNEEKFSCLINKSFQVASVSISGKKTDFQMRSDRSDSTLQNCAFGHVRSLEILIPSDLRKSNEIVFDIEYEGYIFEKPASLEMEDVGKTTGTISEEGVYLSPACAWYPDVIGSLAAFQMTVVTPAGYEAVTHGALVSRKVIEDKIYAVWEERNALDECYLVAGKYKVAQLKHHDIDVYAFFFPEDQGLADTYLNAAARYLDMYQNLLGRYPYKKFAIVENFFQTGYGMPSFTLLGNSVVKLPFIVDTSLGHEILHNWWGNSVYVDESQGNWCEGLTTYMADYYYKELKDSISAEEYRKDICRKYTNYVTDKNDFPLKDFRGRSDQATRAIGYGKTAMVFHMLRRMVGDEVFYTSLRRFYKEKIWEKAGWEDIRRIFEDIGKMDLSWFFEQWINREGAPFLVLGKTEAKKNKDGWTTTIEIIQRDNVYRVSVPVQMELEGGNYYTIAELKEPSQSISIQTQTEPRSLTIDPYYEVFRRLSLEEIPPTIDSVLGDHKKIIVYPTGGERSSQEAYKNLAELLSANRGNVKSDIEITEAEIAQKSLFILGGLTENKLTKRLMENLPGDFSLDEGSFVINKVRYQEKGDAMLVSFRNVKNRTKGIILFAALSSDAIKSVGFKIPHYGKYSYLAFTDGKNVDKGIFAMTDGPLQRSLSR